MAPKTSKATSTTPTLVAPEVGVDAEFDETWGKIWESITSAGNPDGLVEEEAREIAAQRMVKYAGKEYAPAGPRKSWQDPEPEMPPEQRVVRTLVIPTPSDEPVWWDDPVQAEFLDHFILTRRALGNRFHGGLLIAGPAGVGKTTSVGKAIERINAAHGLSMRLLKMDCATVTDPQKWFGRREVSQEKGTHYVESDFIEANKRGDVILLDDITRLHPHIHNGIMSFLDGSNSVLLSDLNVVIQRNPNTVYLATANIGAQFSGTHRMDAAMRERFPYTIDRGWPPRDVEIAILTSHTGCDQDGAAILVDAGQKTRDMYEAGDLRSPVSTRTLVAAAWLVASGMSEREALELTAVPLYDPDANGLAGSESERQKVRGYIDLKLGH
jgi:MoxR-like ATPase